MKAILVVTVPAVFALAVFAVAPGRAAADPVLECNTGASSQVELAECVAGMEDRVDAAIEAALGFAMSSATDLDEITGRDVALPALEASQATWTAYRDAQCDFVGASFGGGSGTGIAVRACRVDLGRARVMELLRYAQ
jgi:uncharacterized protein YecT (DUF1311 family)